MSCSRGNDDYWLDSSTGERFGAWLGGLIDRLANTVLFILAGGVVTTMLGIDREEVEDLYELY
jgi:hypothetical protein